MGRLWIALLLWVGLTATADAQKNCTKGIPCGKTCISASKVCCVGTSAPQATSAAPAKSTKPQCTTGKPCGNSCISADKVCRVGDALGSSQPRDEKGRYIRSSSARARFLRLTGYPNGRPGYLVDHIIPLSCGGPDTPENMQWQTIDEAKRKDAYERKNC
jgi:hypothetical protein